MLLLLAFLSGCNQASPANNPEPVTDLNSSDSEVSAAEEIESPESDGQKLILWTPSFFDPEPSVATAASTILKDAYDQFEAENPESIIEVQTKSEQVGSTLYEYISSAHKVAPSILPDIIMVESQRLWAIADQKLILPLSINERSTLEGMYTFSQEAVTYQGAVYGIPYTANILHAVQPRQGAADSENAPIPATWQELSDADTTYIFPAGGRNGQSNDAILLQYVGAGGTLRADSSATDAPTALVDVLNFTARHAYSQTILAYSDIDSIWLSSTTDLSGLTEISSNRYLEQRITLNDFAFGPTPTQSGQTKTVGRVWAFAILSEEPEQRQLALKLIKHLVNPSVFGSWSFEAKRLPTQRAALERWGTDDAYYTFAHQQLESAIALPNGTTFVGFTSDVHDALLAVLSGEIDAEKAVENMGNNSR